YNSQKFAAMACGVILLSGQHIRIRRIRAINFGTQTQRKTFQVECFVINIGGTNAFFHRIYGWVASDHVIEDCIIEKPAENSTYTVSCYVVATGFDGVLTSGQGGTIRNCFLNCEYSNGFSNQLIPILSLKRETDPADGTPTLGRLVTKLPHTHIKEK